MAAAAMAVVAEAINAVGRIAEHVDARCHKRF